METDLIALGCPITPSAVEGKRYVPSGDPGVHPTSVTQELKGPDDFTARAIRLYSDYPCGRLSYPQGRVAQRPYQEIPPSSEPNLANAANNWTAEINQSRQVLGSSYILRVSLNHGSNTPVVA